LVSDISTDNEFGEKLRKQVDYFVYNGNSWVVRKAADSPHKGIGEVAHFLSGFRHIPKDFDFYFKISGRYKLNENYDESQWDFEKFNLKWYGETISTRLYGFPQTKLEDWRKCLLKCVLPCLKGKSIEETMGNVLKNEEFHNLDVLGLEGLVGPDGSQIKE
jgi:hypothetical protein